MEGKSSHRGVLPKIPTRSSKANSPSSASLRKRNSEKTPNLKSAGADLNLTNSISGGPSSGPPININSSTDSPDAQLTAEVSQVVMTNSQINNFSTFSNVSMADSTTLVDHEDIDIHNLQSGNVTTSSGSEEYKTPADDILAQLSENEYTYRRPTRSRHSTSPCAASKLADTTPDCAEEVFVTDKEKTQRLSEINRAALRFGHDPERAADVVHKSSAQGHSKGFPSAALAYDSPGISRAFTSLQLVSPDLSQPQTPSARRGLRSSPVGSPSFGKTASAARAIALGSIGEAANKEKRARKAEAPTSMDKSPPHASPKPAVKRTTRSSSKTTSKGEGSLGPMSPGGLRQTTLTGPGGRFAALQEDAELQLMAPTPAGPSLCLSPRSQSSLLRLLKADETAAARFFHIPQYETLALAHEIPPACACTLGWRCRSIGQDITDRLQRCSSCENHISQWCLAEVGDCSQTAAPQCRGCWRAATGARTRLVGNWDIISHFTALVFEEDALYSDFGLSAEEVYYLPPTERASLLRCVRDQPSYESIISPKIRELERMAAGEEEGRADDSAGGRGS